MAAYGPLITRMSRTLPASNLVMAVSRSSRAGWNMPPSAVVVYWPARNPRTRGSPTMVFFRCTSTPVLAVERDSRSAELLAFWAAPAAPPPPDTLALVDPAGAAGAAPLSDRGAVAPVWATDGAPLAAADAWAPPGSDGAADPPPDAWAPPGSDGAAGWEAWAPDGSDGVAGAGVWVVSAGGGC